MAHVHWQEKNWWYKSQQKKCIWKPTNKFALMWFEIITPEKCEVAGYCTDKATSLYALPTDSDWLCLPVIREVFCLFSTIGSSVILTYAYMLISQCKASKYSVTTSHISRRQKFFVVSCNDFCYTSEDYFFYKNDHDFFKKCMCLVIPHTTYSSFLNSEFYLFFSTPLS